MYKNIEKQVKLSLKDQVEYQQWQVVSKTLVQNEFVSMTIFSFDRERKSRLIRLVEMQWLRFLMARENSL